MTAEHIPTDVHRNLVKVLAGMGTVHARIAEQLSISEPTLYKYYDEELKTAKTSIDAIAYSALLENIKKGKEVSILFYLKARCGWKETSVVEVEGLPPIVFNVKFGDKPAAPLPPSEQAKLDNWKKTPVIDGSAKEIPTGNT